jgi:hypothetical protein
MPARPEGPSQPRRPRLTLRRLLILPATFAAVFSLLDASGALTPTGLIFGMIAGSALSLALAMTRTWHQAVGITGGFAAGVIVGLPLMMRYTGGPPVILIGAFVGLLVIELATLPGAGGPSVPDGGSA